MLDLRPRFNYDIPTNWDCHVQTNLWFKNIKGLEAFCAFYYGSIIIFQRIGVGMFKPCYV